MLRVGLTGGLGSGKSTVGEYLRELGAEVIEADEMGRALMAPGQDVFEQIVRTFGAEVVAADGRLDRAQLAKVAFRGGRLQELNAIVHPAVIEQQRQWMEEVFARDPKAVAVVVSALIFEVERDARARGETEGVLADWRRRMDRVILVTASDELKVRRYVDRLGLPEDRRVAAESDAHARLGHQIRDADKTARADYVLENHGDREALRVLVKPLWEQLAAESNKRTARGFLE
ncbi:MAG TPA: dephospho-CoA kinase [Terracidiphilus sp.]|nr:dephospho-CoA kinase [Terracidiphilus sp.]